MSQTSSIPCDFANLGHVLACIGLMECEAAASTGARAIKNVQETASGAFIDTANGSEFHLRSPSGYTINGLVEELMSATLSTLHPAGHSLIDKSVFNEGVPNHVWSEDQQFPSLPPKKATALPISIDTTNWQVRVSSWAEATQQTRRDSAKFWAGNYTGASVAMRILLGTQKLNRYQRDAIQSNPFEYTAALSSSYRMDFTRDYIPIDSGFSPNDQGNVKMLGHPLVELLAVIGLEHARPERLHNKLAYRYQINTDFAELPLVRANFSCAETGLPSRIYAVQLGWPGQEGQARCITKIVEEEV